jgi:hypothetical protein
VKKAVSLRLDRTSKTRSQSRTTSIQEVVALDQKVSQSPSGAEVALGPDGAGAAGFGVGVAAGAFGGSALGAGLATGLVAVALIAVLASGALVEVDGFVDNGFFAAGVAAGRGAAAGRATGAAARAIAAGAATMLVTSPAFGLGSLTLK